MPNDQYQIGELLGRGGMGQVYSARHRSGRLVAVKRVRDTLLHDRLVVERLADEARLLRAVSHPNVVRAFDDGTGSDGMPFLVMERAHGTPLNQLIAQHGSLPPERLIVIASQLLAGLAAIHDVQVVHADLKSHNVLVDEVNIVTIIDFGLARLIGGSATEHGLIAGTPAYMAPEMIAGACPAVTGDLYAAATIIYEMLTGSTPFSGHVSTILTRQLSEPVQAPSLRAPHRGISPAVDRVVLRALDTSPTTRYQTAYELAAAFATAFNGAFRGVQDPEPALAIGTELWVEAPTMPRVRIAAGRGTTEDPPDEPNEIDAIITSALSRAQWLIDDQQQGRAIEELETALASLQPPSESDAPKSPVVWRIETVLAALYDSLGKLDRARRMALVAYRHALDTGCPLAQSRASVLVDRLVARGPRLARGSVGKDR